MQGSGTTPNPDYGPNPNPEVHLLRVNERPRLGRCTPPLSTLNCIHEPHLSPSSDTFAHGRYSPCQICRPFIRHVQARRRGSTVSPEFQLAALRGWPAGCQIPPASALQHALALLDGAATRSALPHSRAIHMCSLVMVHFIMLRVYKEENASGSGVSCTCDVILLCGSASPFPASRPVL